MWEQVLIDRLSVMGVLVHYCTSSDNVVEPGFRGKEILIKITTT